MTSKAFVLIETDIGKSKAVTDVLRKLEGVDSVDIVTGPYDVIAVIHGETLNDVGELITEKIHPVPNISRTVTCLVMEEDRK